MNPYSVKITSTLIHLDLDNYPREASNAIWHFFTTPARLVVDTERVSNFGVFKERRQVLLVTKDTSQNIIDGVELFAEPIKEVVRSVVYIDNTKYFQE